MCLATFGVSRIMSEITRNLRRRAPRFQIKNSDVLNVTVSKGEQASEPIDAEIVNVSVGGAKFKSITDCLACTRHCCNKPTCMPKERQEFCRSVTES